MERLAEEAELVFVFAEVSANAFAFERAEDIGGAVGLGEVVLQGLKVIAVVLFFFLGGFEGVAGGGDGWRWVSLVVGERGEGGYLWIR